MLILAVETSGMAGSIALLNDETVVAERSLPREGRRHAQALVQEVDDAVRAAGLQPTDVAVVAVSIGPGSFTGLRVGVVFAKTWCYATGAKLVAVDTLQAAAEQSPREIDCVFSIVDAQRGDLYVGEYRRYDAGMSSAGPIAVINSADFCKHRSPDDFVTGPGLERYGAMFETVCRVALPDDQSPQATTVAAIGRRLAESGEFADVWTLEPFYLRKSAAEEKREAAK